MKKKKSIEKEKEITLENPITDNFTASQKQTTSEQTSEPVSLKTISEQEHQQKINEQNDKFLRLYSEFDNFRKRTLKEKIELSRTASEDLIKDLLPVLDDFDRALEAMQSTNQIEAVRDGVQLIHSKFKSILNSKGLQEIKSKGEMFDTDFHEAITSISAPNEAQKNQVLDEIQKGYTLHEKVIRFAKVVIGN